MRAFLAFRAELAVATPYLVTPPYPGTSGGTPCVLHRTALVMLYSLDSVPSQEYGLRFGGFGGPPAYCMRVHTTNSRGFAGSPPGVSIYLLGWTTNSRLWQLNRQHLFSTPHTPPYRRRKNQERPGRHPDRHPSRGAGPGDRGGSTLFCLSVAFRGEGILW